MGALRWKRGQFAITGNLMARPVFETWIAEEGKAAMRDALRNTRCRWLFGHTRARRRLYRETRAAVRARGIFAETLRKRATRFPTVVRACGLAVRKLGYTGLCTYDAEKVLTVVPRAIVQHDFAVHLLKELNDLPQVRDYRGLTDRVIRSAAFEAEVVLFEHLVRRPPLVDETGRGLIIEVDRDFPWKIGAVNGHYYYAYSVDDRIDLTHRPERRRFLTAMAEMLQGQRVHLKRMPPDEVADLRGAIELRRAAGGGPPREHSALARVRVRLVQETEEPVFGGHGRGE